MKYKYILITLFCLIGSVLKAQVSTTISHHTISWKGIDKWLLNNTSIDVLTFGGAQYPMENRLPFFNQKQEIDKAFTYNVELINPKFIRLTEEESKLLTGIALSSNFDVKSSLSSQSNTKFLEINILPFVRQNGIAMRLTDFDIKISKLNSPQKVSSSTLHTYSSKSVLSQGKFVKVKIKDTGVYKLTFEDLSSMGIDPANVKVFGYGGAVLEQNFMLPKNDDLPEVAIWMSKGSDGIFNSGDYILFYGQGINRWTYDKSKLAFTHIGNTYSKYGYYFITADVGAGKKILDKQFSIDNNLPLNVISEFIDYKLYEKESINIIGLNGDVGSGREFYGEKFSDVTTISIPFNFPNAIQTKTTSARLDVAASSTVNSNFNLTLNGTQNVSLGVSARYGGDTYEVGKANSGTFLFTPQNDAFNFTLSYSKPSSTSIGFLNYLEVNARRQLKMVGSYMPFQNYDNYNVNSVDQFQLTSSNSNVQIWDVTDPINIDRVLTQATNGNMTFKKSALEASQFVAIDPTDASSFLKPEIEGLVPNQNLHGLSPVDMVILTHPNFILQAEKLAQAHREMDNLTVEVVTTDQVYNEFSSGTPDATAYRWVMKMLYDKAIFSNNTNDLPKYLLLFGRGSFDNRKISQNTGDNLILTYQAENSLSITSSYVTDDYFGLLDDNEGTNVPSNLLDIGIGRFPVSTLQQAEDVVNKTINYMNNKEKGYWKNQLCFLADDGDGALHMKQSDSIASSLSRMFPAYHYNKIFLDAYKQEITASGESYPLAKSKFQNLLQSGMLLVNYTGHANTGGWSNEAILTSADVKNLSGKNLPLYVAATCDFLQYDIRNVSGGEQVFLNPTGGGIGIFSAARPVYSSQNFTLNKFFCEELFKKINGKNIRLGDVVKNAKNATGSEINKLSYVFMGDPAVTLNYPTKFKVITTKVNENSIQIVDTLRALSVAKIEGSIVDETGNKITNFNGSLHAVVFDKSQRITSLNNHNDGTITFSDRQNTLFAGDAEVKNGDFSFSFMLPKDIKYNYGTGSINYYAEDDINNFEAQGVFDNFIVGGSNKDFVYEVDGPEVRLSLNSDNFQSGGKVNESPLFIANIKDLSGINTVGSGIGHDLMLTIDQDPLQSYNLNANFQAVTNSFSEGQVKYKLPLLKEGKHTLSFKVFDLLNNSTTKTIDFEVVSGLKPIIFSVSNYPNPVKTSTKISVFHDRPETILNTTVDIIDLSGRIIWTFSQSSADEIVWNLPTDNKITPGIYLYRVSVKTNNSDVYSKTNKMIIVAQ